MVVQLSDRSTRGRCWTSIYKVRWGTRPVPSPRQKHLRSTSMTSTIEKRSKGKFNCADLLKRRVSVLFWAWHSAGPSAISLSSQRPTAVCYTGVMHSIVPSLCWVPWGWKKAAKLATPSLAEHGIAKEGQCSQWDTDCPHSMHLEGHWR